MTRPVYIIDDQKRVTLGPLVSPGEQFDVVPEEDGIRLQPRPDGRVKVDGRRRLSLGRLVAAGAIFRIDTLPDGVIFLAHLWLIDPSSMSPDLASSIQDYRVDT